MFLGAFTLFANRPCVRDGDRVATYEEVLAMGRARLAELPHPRSFVILRCALDLETIATYTALCVDGHVPLLVERTLDSSLLEALAARYQPDAVIDYDLTHYNVTAARRPKLHPDLSLLLSTSGSTGSPKLVRFSRQGLTANAEAIVGYLGLDEAERPLLSLPLSYSFGLSIVNSHLLAGATIGVTRSTLMLPTYWDDLKTHRATSIAGVPFFYQTLRRFGEDRLELESLRTLTQAGGRLDPKLVSYFAGWARRTGRRFFVMYGQTEAGPRISYVPPEAAEAAPDAIGVPLPGVTITLQDESGKPVAAGETGEMHIRSPGVMLGYAQCSADLSLGDEMGGSLATGDLAQLGPDGLLRIVGRLSRMIKVYGLRVNLEDVERQLKQLGYQAYCFGLDDQLKVLLEGEGGEEAMPRLAEARATITHAFSIPSNGVDIRMTTSPPQRSSSGKLTDQSLSAAWAMALRR